MPGAWSSSAAGFGPDSADSFMQRVAADTNRPDAAATFLRQGTVLAGRFVVERFARRGGMGTIYQGRDTSNGAPVAIKSVGRLRPDSESRFLREIRILADLAHPGIVNYLDHGT